MMSHFLDKKLLMYHNFVLFFIDAKLNNDYFWTAKLLLDECTKFNHIEICV